MDQFVIRRFSLCLECQHFNNKFNKSPEIKASGHFLVIQQAAFFIILTPKEAGEQFTATKSITLCEATLCEVPLQ